jgi:protein O-GlcNAc transferase
MSKRLKKKNSRKKTTFLQKVNPVAQTFTVSDLIQNAAQYNAAGEWQQAEAIYRLILQVQPSNNEALSFYHQLGNAFRQRGQFDDAETCFQRVLTYNPKQPAVYNDLGIVFTSQHKIPEAFESFKLALRINPDHVDALYNLGILFQSQHQLEQAIDCYQRAVALMPHETKIHNNLGIAFYEQGQFSQAIECYQQVLDLNANHFEAYNNLGIVFRYQGQLAKALKHFRMALALNPNFVDAYTNLGDTFRKLGKITAATYCLKRALALNPNAVEAHNNLGLVFMEQGLLVDAINSYQQALSLKPLFVKAHNNMGCALKAQGSIQKAIKHYQNALDIEPTSALAHSNLLFTLNYITDFEPATLFSEHQLFYERYAKPLAHTIQLHHNERSPQRKLKIAYLSADFRKHSVAYFIKPVLSQHDHNQFEVFCYYTDTQYDNLTQCLQQYADHWHDCADLSDEALAEKIRQDQIDILIDLAGHTRGNRLLVFARKPAPIQVTYLGYVNTTGLETIDYRIIDHHTDPEVTEQFLTEAPIRMPHSYCCFDPSLEDSPRIKELPAIKNGYITFSSFNTYPKISPETIALWAKVLHAVPCSKFVIKTKSLNDQSIQSSLRKRFAELGIDTERLILGYIPSIEETLRTYNQIDIGLDSYPYNGCTTTCQALWMGVPIVTLVGNTHAARVGLSFLSTLELPELIAYNEEDYVNRCVKLASDIEFLQKLRSELRDKMRTSPLMDAQTYTHQLEVAYREMWNKWCFQS